MIGKWWALLKDTVSGFLADDALSRGAAIAYYTIFSVAPLLLIVIAIAGLVFGHAAAQHAILGQMSGMMGQQSADTLETMINSAGNRSAGTVATIIGIGTLLLTASGAFGEIQSSLNAIWKAEPQAGLSRLVRARVASLGLVMTLGFLMLVSLVVSAGLTALDAYLRSLFPAAHLLMLAVNFVISLGLISALFAAVYKILPDKQIEWRDVAIGAVATALLFTVGKTLIGLYIGSSKIASSYGAGGALIIILLWVYYSAQIFLLGAEFTRAYAERHGSHAPHPDAAAQSEPAEKEARGRSWRPPHPAAAAAPQRAPASPEALAREAAAARQQLDRTWQVLRARVPGQPRPSRLDTPDLPGALAKPRASWMQIAVAGLASFVLPAGRKAHEPSQATSKPGKSG